MRYLPALVFLPLIVLSPAPALSELQHYQPVAELSGLLRIVGSDTLHNLMDRWEDEFNKHYPGMKFQREARGSATAPSALIGGKSDLAPMSRKMVDNEIRAYEAQFGYVPVFIRVALDAVGVYVHKKNPIRGLTLEKLDDIFSATQACGGSSITQWGALVFGSFADKPIKLYGRNTFSGTYEFFRKHALCAGEFKQKVLQQPDSAAVVKGVSSSIEAIGYSGIGFRTPNVRAIPLAKREDAPYYSYYLEKHKNDPDLSVRYKNVISGHYPLSRFLFIYVNKAPGKPLPLMIEEFIKFVLSHQGQRIVHEIGFIPLPEKIAGQQLTKLAASYAPSWLESVLEFFREVQ